MARSKTGALAVSTGTATTHDARVRDKTRKKSAPRTSGKQRREAKQRKRGRASSAVLRRAHPRVVRRGARGVAYTDAHMSTIACMSWLYYRLSGVRGVRIQYSVTGHVVTFDTAAGAGDKARAVAGIREMAADIIAAVPPLEVMQDTVSTPSADDGRDDTMAAWFRNPVNAAPGVFCRSIGTAAERVLRTTNTHSHYDVHGENGSIPRCIDAMTIAVLALGPVLMGLANVLEGMSAAYTLPDCTLERSRRRHSRLLDRDRPKDSDQRHTARNGCASPADDVYVSHFLPYVVIEDIVVAAFALTVPHMQDGGNVTHKQYVPRVVVGRRIAPVVMSFAAAHADFRESALVERRCAAAMALLRSAAMTDAFVPAVQWARDWAVRTVRDSFAAANTS